MIRTRRTFASVADDFGFSELTIKGLLGLAPRRVTQGYIQLDAALIVAADQVSTVIAEAFDNSSTGLLRRAVRWFALVAA